MPDTLSHHLEKVSSLSLWKKPAESSELSKEDHVAGFCFLDGRQRWRRQETDTLV